MRCAMPSEGLEVMDLEEAFNAQSMPVMKQIILLVVPGGQGRRMLRNEDDFILDLSELLGLCARKGRREMTLKSHAMAVSVGVLCGAASTALFFSIENEPTFYAMSPLVMQVLVTDCLALKGTPIPKYPTGEPQVVYRVDCTR